MHLKSVTLHPESYPTREKYPFSLPVFQQAETVPFPTPVTLFVGENGTGKSTLLEAISRQSGIHIWQEAGGMRVEHNPYEEMLYASLELEWADGRVPGSFFGSRTFNYFTHALDEWAATDPGQLKYFGGQSLVTLSHGQSLMAYFRARYRIEGLYLLDEPESALSPRKQLALRELLIRASQSERVQFIVATHSPILLSLPGASILSFDGAQVNPVALESTEHYRVYRDFFAARDRR